MAKTNTEKPAGKAQEKKQNVGAKSQKQKKEINQEPVQKKEEKTELKTPEKKETESKNEEKKATKKQEPKRFKKEITSVFGSNLPISTKVAASICKFILKKGVEKSILDLEEVTKMKRAIPMKGEYSHRKGKIMSGKYPVKAAKEFLILLKSLKGNANNHSLENPIITEAFANKGTTVYTSGGRTRKRTHVKIFCKEKKEKKK